MDVKVLVTKGFCLVRGISRPDIFVFFLFCGSIAWSYGHEPGLDYAELALRTLSFYYYFLRDSACICMAMALLMSLCYPFGS